MSSRLYKKLSAISLQPSAKGWIGRLPMEGPGLPTLVRAHAYQDYSDEDKRQTQELLPRERFLEEDPRPRLNFCHVSDSLKKIRAHTKVQMYPRETNG